MVDGAIFTPLRQICDERGKVMHMRREDSPLFSHFGEIYFSCTFPGAIKPLHLHTRMRLNYAVVYGAIKCLLFEDRLSSNTFGETNDFFLSADNYSLLTVIPLIWNGWKGIVTETSISANCATIIHQSDEIKRKPAFDSYIQYNW